MSWQMFFVVYAASIVASWLIGSRKGEGLGGIAIGLLLGPLGVLVALASSGRIRSARLTDVPTAGS